MAFPSSSIGGMVFQDVFDASQQAFNFTLTTYKTALFTNTSIQNPKTDTAYNTGGGSTVESSGTGYSTGGIVVASPVVSDAGGSSDSIFKFTIANPSWASSSITARGMVYFADPITPKYPICYVNFGSDFVSTNGTFLVTIHANGLFTIDLTP